MAALAVFAIVVLKRPQNRIAHHSTITIFGELFWELVLWVVCSFFIGGIRKGRNSIDFLLYPLNNKHFIVATGNRKELII
jgi:hypothetical protein